MQLDQGQIGSIMAEVKWKINVPFFGPLRHSRYDSNQHITNFHNGVRLAQWSWLAFLDWHENRTVSFWGIYAGNLLDVYMKSICTLLTYYERYHLLITIKIYIRKKPLKDRRQFLTWTDTWFSFIIQEE